MERKPSEKSVVAKQIEYENEMETWYKIRMDILKKEESSPDNRLYNDLYLKALAWQDKLKDIYLSRNLEHADALFVQMVADKKNCQRALS